MGKPASLKKIAAKMPSAMDTLRLELDTLTKEAVFLRAENVRLAASLDREQETSSQARQKVEYLRTGMKFTLDRLGTWNRSLATMPVTDGMRTAVMLVDGILNPVLTAYLGVADFLPQREE